MQDERLTIRIPFELKVQLQDRALAESCAGPKVTLSDVVIRSLTQTVNRWATATSKKAKA